MTLWSNPDQALVLLAGWVRDALARWHPALGDLAVMVLSTAPLIAIFAGLFAISTWVERKVLARIQNRPGPNRVGPFGLLQPVADGLKMLLKEDIVPAEADRLAHFLAPVLVMVPATVVMGFLPYGRNMTPVVMESGLVFFFAIGTLSTMAVFLAGWSSYNKYSLLGGMRAIAQMVSYEIPLVLSAVVAVMYAGTLNTAKIVEAQQIGEWVRSGSPVLQCLGQVCGWYVFTPWGLAGFIIFFIAAVAEVNRSPFDLPEADSEIIAGHLTEYSGFKYALFFIAEYMSAFAGAGMAVTLFLGGWSGPNIRPPWSHDPDALLIPGFVWFFLKMYGLFLVMVWMRGTLPRLRVDQLMAFAWKFLMPMALANIVATGVFYHTPGWIGWPASAALITGVYLLLVRVSGLHRGANRAYRYAQ